MLVHTIYGMEKIITFEEWKRRDFDRTGITRYKLIITCEKCKKIYTPLLKAFSTRDKWVPCCIECYRKFYCYDEEWRKNNREAQLIAQNRPEVLEKQKQAQLKRWELGGEALREQYIQITKTLWEREDYRENQINKIRENWEKEEYREKIFTSYRQYFGIYRGNHYSSLVELSFLLWCEERKVSVKNYDLPGIPYFWKNKWRKYYPDYIITNDTIVEVKGKGRWYTQEKEMIEKKFSVLTEWCKEHTMKCRMVFDTDLGKTLWKKAKEVHFENNKENNSSVCGKSS